MSDELELVEMTLNDITTGWRPGSHDTHGAGEAWTWADESLWLLTNQTEYQLGVIRRAHLEQSVDWLDVFAPICLGADGRVWDGHHRICAALALGIKTAHVDVLPVLAQREDQRRRAVLFNDIGRAPRKDSTYWWLSDRQQLADHLWAQGWRRDVRPEDETETVTYDGYGAPIVHTTEEPNRG
jgi:hypothetical protein